MHRAADRAGVEGFDGSFLMPRAILLVGFLALTTTAFAGSSSRYQEMSAEELQQVIQKHPVAFIPAGIVEWHGPQSACGLDALKAETLCRMAADSLGGVCFPTLWLGPDASTPFEPASFPRGTLTIDQPLYVRAVEEVLEGIESLGFRVAVHLSGHYPGVIPSLAARFDARGKLTVISISENQVVRGMPAGDHAAAWETSMLMALRPGLVDLGRLPGLPTTTRPAGEVIPPPWPFLQQTEYYGVYGADPRIWANVTFGRRGTEAVIDGLALEILGPLRDPAYGLQRRPLTWSRQELHENEVRYEFQLPHQWLARFMAAPIVYWPLSTSSQPDERASGGCAKLAREYGGLVFPTLSYGPASGRWIGFGRESWQGIVLQVVERLAEMGFRIVVLQSEEAIDGDLADRLAALQGPDGLTRVIRQPAGLPNGKAVSELRAAVRSLIPPPSAVSRRMADGWTIDGRYLPANIEQAAYGPPGEARVYERTFELSDSEAAGSALLDLGAVENWCEVAVNGLPIGRNHWPPYQFLLTGRVRPGRNTLAVTVRHQPQPSLDRFFYRSASPRLVGPVTLKSWTP